MNYLSLTLQNGQVLNNYAKFGSDSRKLRVGLNGLFATEGDPTFIMTNEIHMSVETTESEVWTYLIANVDAAKLFNFPLRDVTNLQCWLYTLLTPDSIHDTDEETGFAIVNTLLLATSMKFNVTCASCTSSSLSILPEIVQSFEKLGVLDVLGIRFVKLALEILRSDYIQEFINKSLIDSTIQCPHSPQFVGPSASFSENAPAPNYPSLNLEALETIVFASTIVLDIAAVIIAQAHEPYDLDVSFPLSGQYDLNLPDDMRLVDFVSLETSVGDGASTGFDSLVAFLNEGIDGPEGRNSGRNLRVNRLVTSSLLDENRSLSLSFDDINLAKAGMGIYLKEVRIIGLDTISEVKVLDAIGAQTLQNEITWGNIRIQLVVSLEDPNGGSSNDITISASLSDVHMSLAIFLAMDVDLLESIQLNGMMDLKNILPCLMSTAHTASITELEVSVGSFNGFSIEGFNSDDLSSAAYKSSRFILEKYGGQIIALVPKFFDSTVRGLLNNLMKYYSKESLPEFCKYSSSEKFTGFVDLRDLLWYPKVAFELGGAGLSQYGDMFRTAIGFVRDIFKIDESTGLSGLNDVIVAPFTLANYNESGAVYYSGDLFEVGKRIQIGAIDTNVQFHVYDAKIENLDTIGDPLELFGGIIDEPYMLNNTMTFVDTRGKPLRFSFKFYLSLEDEGDEKKKDS